jgi:protocatechuate 3,4-dioxygenase beta subunit
MRFTVRIDSIAAWTSAPLRHQARSASRITGTIHHLTGTAVPKPVVPMTSAMKRVAAYLVTGLLFAGFGFAQTFNASLGGTVTDVSGAVVPKAMVTVTGIETGVQTKTITNSSGVYEFPSLQEGNYRLSAEMAGFKQYAY